MSHGRLTDTQKSLGKLSFSPKLERTEILVPPPIGYFGSCLYPESELIQIFKADISIAHALDQVVPERGGKARPGLGLRHSFTEDKAAHLVTEPFHFLGVCGCTKAFC